MDTSAFCFVVLYIGKGNFWEGKINDKQGWFPRNAITATGMYCITMVVFRLVIYLHSVSFNQPMNLLLLTTIQHRKEAIIKKWTTPHHHHPHLIKHRKKLKMLTLKGSVVNYNNIRLIKDICFIYVNVVHQVSSSQKLNLQIISSALRFVVVLVGMDSQCEEWKVTSY